MAFMVIYDANVLFPEPSSPTGPVIRTPFEVVSFSGELHDLPMVGLKDSENSVFGYLLLDDEVRIELLPEHLLVAAALKSARPTPASTALLYGVYDGLRRFYYLPWKHEMAFQEALVVELLRDEH